jgi:hypothetical protein
MLRILNHIAKQLLSLRLDPTLGHFITDLHPWRKRLRAGGRERAPGVEFAVGPVRVGGPDGPAAEDAVRAVCGGPFGQQGARGVGELAVADVLLVREGVVFGDELARA